MKSIRLPAMKTMTRNLLFLLCFLVLLGCNNNSGKKKSNKQAKKASEIQKQKQDDRKQREKDLAEARLDEKKQEFIFNAEHVTFVIEQVFGSEWKKAFKNGDDKKLIGFYFDEFAGRSISDLELETVQVSVVTQKSRSASSDKPDGETAGQEVDAAKLIEYLMGIKKQFSNILRLKLRVLEIDQPVADHPIWKCKILLDVVGESEPGKPKQYLSEQSVIFEIENESELATRPSISEWNIEKETFRDSEQFLSQEVTDETLISEVQLANNWELEVKHTEQYWFQYSVEDFDRDGKLDFAVACNQFRPKLFYNAKGNRFIEVSTERDMIARGGIVRLGTSFGCAWLDFNNDGYPDLINGLSLFESDKGLSFKDIYWQSGLSIRTECMGILVADYDCDGLVDIYLLYQSSNTGSKSKGRKQWVNETFSGAENELWKNMGNGKFVNVTKKANAGGGKRHTHAASWFFYDDDHYPDLYIANDFGTNVLLRNKGDGTFEDISKKTETAGYATSMGVSTGDLNNDGKSEIYVANMFSKMGRRIIGQVGDEDYPPGIYDQIKGSCAGNRLYTRGDNEEFKEIGEDIGVHDVGWAYGPSLTDFDQDGLLDIYATTGFMSFQRDKPDG